MYRLKEKVIVITGASSGAGKAMALELASHGGNLVLAARSKHALDEVAQECRELGADVEVIVTDMRVSQDVQILAKAAFEWGGRIDVWINNAGVLAAGALDDMPAIINENVIRTNLIGYINGAQEVLPYFKIQGYGTLINNISVGGWLPTPYATAYSASKFGIRGFSEALKGELAGFRDIHVVDLYPGFLDTPGLQHAANYTGKVLRPAPPVYDARKLAKAVVRLIETPISRKTVGASSGFLRLSYALFPKLTRNITGMVIRNYLKQAEAIDHTSGNILHPVEYGTSVDGGWRLKQLPKEATTALLIFGAVAIGVFLAGSRK